jgi:chromosome segregation ATPase
MINTYYVASSLSRVTQTTNSDRSARVRAENIGGITRTSVELDPGVTVLVGRNATNRTSFLHALMGALGTDGISIKSDADHASVQLHLDGEEYTRTFSRTNGSTVADGTPYLDDPTVANLFAFLLESNEARRAVSTGGDLREIIMRPVDTDAIQAEIERTLRERSDIDDELDHLDSLKNELPTLEERRNELEAQIETKRAEMADIEADIDDLDADIDETRDRKAALEERLTELRDHRSSLEQVRSDIELQQESIESLRAERADLEAERDQLTDSTTGDPDSWEQQAEQLRDRKEQLESEVSELQDVIAFNEQRLDDTELATNEQMVEDTSSDQVPTDRLLEDSTVRCWTCGSEVDRERTVETVDRLKEARSEKLSTVRELEDDIDDVTRKRREHERRRQRRETLQRKLDEIADEIERREETLDTRRSERDRLWAEVEALEAEIDELEFDDVGDILDLHREANQLEFDIETLESERDDVVDRIGEIEEQLETEDRLRAQREDVRAELEDLRTRIEQLETDAVEAFNEHMDQVLSVLAYKNVERIWIERTQPSSSTGRTNDATTFDLHVVRSSDSGTKYEDTVDHLSESEREVTGIVFALAGYLVHEVYESVPFMLLDSLEASDSERLAELVDYLAGYPEYLVVAMLPEDAERVSSRYDRIEQI